MRTAASAAKATTAGRRMPVGATGRLYLGSDCPPESFTINTGNQGGTTPEPSSFILIGSGVIGIVGVLRRKLF